MNPPTIRTVVTENSVWKLDVALRRYVRFPRSEAPEKALIPYTCTWEPFTALERFHDRLIVHRPVPFGQGARRMTGPIEWDDLDDDSLATGHEPATPLA